MVQNSTSTTPLSELPAKVLARKREILEAAACAFREQGFHRAGMRDIAAALGMTVGNLYYYFENKQALLAFCQEDTVARLLALVRWIESQGLREDAGLYLVVQGHVRCLHAGGGGALAHLEVEELQEPWRERIIEKRDRYEAALRRMLRCGRRNGVFRADIQDKLSALAILGAVNWTALWFRKGGSQSIQSVGSQFAEQLVRGLLLEPHTLERPTVALPRSLFARQG